MPKHIDIDLMRKRFSYNPDTGELTWKQIEVTRPIDITWNKRFAGKVVTTKHNTGTKVYHRCRVDDVPHYVHRIVYAMHYGEQPDEIDHINGNGLDNRIANLRGADRTENARNSKKRCDNTAGFTGVWYSKEKKKWVAEVVGKKLGYFSSIDDAASAAKKKREDLGFHENHGVERPF